MLLGVIQNVHHSGRVIGSVDKSDKKGHRGRMCTQKVMPLTENCWGGRELKGWRRVASQKNAILQKACFLNYSFYNVIHPYYFEFLPSLSFLCIDAGQALGSFCYWKSKWLVAYTITKTSQYKSSLIFS